MLCLAIYVASQALQHWINAPIVVSVDTRSIEDVQFPAVSICRPLSWAWPGIVSVMNNFDPDGELAKESISEGYTWLLSSFFKSQAEPCKTLVKES